MENVLHDLQKGQKGYDDDAGCADDRGHRTHLRATGGSQVVPALGDLDDAGGNEVDQQDERPGIERDKYQLGEPCMEELLHVGEPLLVKTAKKRRHRLAPAEDGKSHRDVRENGGVH